MKITKKNKIYNFEMSEFEAKILLLVSFHIGGIGKARRVFSDGKESISNILKDYPEFSNAIINFSVPGVERTGIIELNGDGFEPIVKNSSYRDKNGKFLTTKHNIRFSYPKKEVRHINRIYYIKNDLERRTILNFNKENGYLTGVDQKDNKFKKFDLNKVSNIRYF